MGSFIGNMNLSKPGGGGVEELARKPERVTPHKDLKKTGQMPWGVGMGEEVPQNLNKNLISMSGAPKQPAVQVRSLSMEG